jgi:hypothetical protein
VELPPPNRQSGVGRALRIAVAILLLLMAGFGLLVSAAAGAWFFEVRNSAINDYVNDCLELALFTGGGLVFVSMGPAIAAIGLITYGRRGTKAIFAASLSAVIIGIVTLLITYARELFCTLVN